MVQKQVPSAIVNKLMHEDASQLPLIQLLHTTSRQDNSRVKDASDARRLDFIGNHQWHVRVHAISLDDVLKASVDWAALASLGFAKEPPQLKNMAP